MIQSINDDQYIGAKIRGILLQDSTTAFVETIQKLPQHQYPLLLEVLEIKSQVTYFEVLNYLSRFVGNTDDFFDHYYPVAISDKPIVLPGESYNALIFLAKRVHSTTNLTIKVNGRPIPIIDGYANFSKRYSTPGKKKYKVSFDIKNPFTKTIETVAREYTVMVRDSCR